MAHKARRKERARVTLHAPALTFHEHVLPAHGKALQKHSPEAVSLRNARRWAKSAVLPAGGAAGAASS